MPALPTVRAAARGRAFLFFCIVQTGIMLALPREADGQRWTRSAYDGYEYIVTVTASHLAVNESVDGALSNTRTAALGNLLPPEGITDLSISGRLGMYRIDLRCKVSSCVQVSYAHGRHETDGSIALGWTDRATAQEAYDALRRLLAGNRAPVTVEGDQLEVSDWVETWESGGGKVIFVRNNSKTHAIRVTWVTVYDCVNYWLAFCQTDQPNFVVPPQGTAELRALPWPMDRTKPATFKYRYGAEWVR